MTRFGIILAAIFGKWYKGHLHWRDFCILADGKHCCRYDGEGD